MAAKNFQGAPFGTQTSRFNVSGIHPQSKTPGTYTQVPYCTKSLRWSKLAPGCYNINSRDPFSTKEVRRKKAGPNWKRAYEVSQKAKIPHLLHRAEAQKKETRIRRLGPGTYRHTDFIEKSESKPRSLRGICATRDKRFGNLKQDKMPGPGTYSQITKKDKKKSCFYHFLSFLMWFFMGSVAYLQREWKKRPPNLPEMLVC